MLGALFIGLAIFTALELHDYRKRRREQPQTTPSVEQIVRSILPQEKAEYMLPMDDGEYERHMEAQSSQGELNDSLESPWQSNDNSPPQKSPSSDS